MHDGKDSPWIKLSCITWISKYIRTRGLYVITHPCHNFSYQLTELLLKLAWMSNYIPHKNMVAITYPCQNLDLFISCYQGHFITTLEIIVPVIITEHKRWSIWKLCHHWLHCKLSWWQLTMSSVRSKLSNRLSFIFGDKNWLYPQIGSRLFIFKIGSGFFFIFQVHDSSFLTLPLMCCLILLYCILDLDQH